MESQEAMNSNGQEDGGKQRETGDLAEKGRDLDKSEWGVAISSRGWEQHLSRRALRPTGTTLETEMTWKLVFHSRASLCSPQSSLLLTAEDRLQSMFVHVCIWNKLLLKHCCRAYRTYRSRCWGSPYWEQESLSAYPKEHVHEWISTHTELQCVRSWLFCIFDVKNNAVRTHKIFWRSRHLTS